MKFFLISVVICLGAVAAELKPIPFIVEGDSGWLGSDCSATVKVTAKLEPATLQWSKSSISAVELCMEPSLGELCPDSKTLKFTLDILNDSANVGTFTNSVELTQIDTSTCITVNPCDIYDNISDATVDLSKLTLQGTVGVQGYKKRAQTSSVSLTMRGVEVAIDGKADISEGVLVKFGGAISIVRSNSDCGASQSCNTTVDKPIFNEATQVAFFDDSTPVPSCKNTSLANKIHYTILTPNADQNCKVDGKETGCDVNLTIESHSQEVTSTATGETEEANNHSTTESAAFTLPAGLALFSLISIF